MSKSSIVGDDFAPNRRKLPFSAAARLLPAAGVATAGESAQFSGPQTTPKLKPLPFLYESLHRYSFAVFALLFLLVSAAGGRVAADIWSAHVISRQPSLARAAIKPQIAGLNLSLSPTDFAIRLKTIEDQSIGISLGTKTAHFDSNAITSWLQISANHSGIHVSTVAISTSLSQLADTNLKSAVDQVTVTHPDGTSHVITAGSDGIALANTASLADQIAKNVLSGQGMSLSGILTTKPAPAVTPANFGKLLEVDLTTKRMYAWQNGQLVRTFLVSAGKPTTPTPIGEFKIWKKLPMQTMTGFNPDGSRYIQPNVQWVNYFDHSGDAVHGNYWRPLSVFGAVNTSHGCVSVIDSEAAWIYNWAPVGTTVITYQT